MLQILIVITTDANHQKLLEENRYVFDIDLGDDGKILIYKAKRLKATLIFKMSATQAEKWDTRELRRAWRFA